MNKHLTLILLTTVLAFTACKEDTSADWKIMNDNWMNIHKNDSGFVTSVSGLIYKNDSAGWTLNPKPNKDNFVNITYTGKLVDGYIFDSGTANLSVSQTVTGFQEGLKMMHPGDNCTLYIPSALAYDTTSTDSRIPANSILIFDIKLNYVY